MQYMLLIYEDERQYEDETALADIIAKHRALVGELGEVFQGGSGLHSTHSATTVRTARDGAKSIHDGPFAETREQLGGYYLVDVPDLDAALAIARRIPTLGEASVEVRPLAKDG